MLISLVVVVVVIIIAFPPSLGNETKLKEKIAQKKRKLTQKQIISAKDGFNRTLLIIINKCGTRKESEENPLE